MQVTIEKSELNGSIKAIASKSHAHRLFICAALSEQESKILCSETSEDIDATLDCLRALGAKITCDEEGFIIKPIWAELNANRTLKCRESGSTLRFMLPIVCALGGETKLYAEGRLPQRPLSPLYEQLQQHGCNLSEQGKMPLLCRGMLEYGKYVLPGNISSQFITGLLFALPLLDGESELKLTGKIESLPYIEMTLQALKQAGIRIERCKQTFYIPGQQKYRAKRECRVEGDWSNAAFWLCAGALQGKGISCDNLYEDSLQGDKEIIPLLNRFGAKIEKFDCAYRVMPAKLHGIEIDAANIPDLVPILSVVACGAHGKTTIYHAERLRIKESDRLQTIYNVLRTLGADIEIKEDGFVIQGHGSLQGGIVQAYGDHRIAMMASIAACLCEQPVTICGAEAVNKSYPRFFSDMRILGAQWKGDA